MAIENVIVKQSAWTERDIELLFEDEEVHFTDATDLSVRPERAAVDQRG